MKLLEQILKSLSEKNFKETANLCEMAIKAGQNRQEIFYAQAISLYNINRLPEALLSTENALKFDGTNHALLDLKKTINDALNFESHSESENLFAGESNYKVSGNKENSDNIPKVSVIIPVWNLLPFTKLCLEYLDRNSPNGLYECLMVDNGSDIETADFLKSLQGENRRLLRLDSNQGFAKACNFAAKSARGNLLVFLNNDTIVQAGWLEELILALEDPAVGIAGAKLVYPDDTIQHAGVSFNATFNPYHIYNGLPESSPCANSDREINAVTGACLAIGKELFFRVKGFDERYFNCLEDIDLCLKIRELGKKILYVHKSKVMHFESQSKNKRTSEDKAFRLFENTWNGRLHQDDINRLKDDDMAIHIDSAGNLEYLSQSEAMKNVFLEKEKAQNFIETGKDREAFNIYKKIGANYPYDPEIWKWMGELFEKYGMKYDAENCRQKFHQYSIN